MKRYELTDGGDVCEIGGDTCLGRDDCVNLLNDASAEIAALKDYIMKLDSWNDELQAEKAALVEKCEQVCRVKEQDLLRDAVSERGAIKEHLLAMSYGAECCADAIRTLIPSGEKEKTMIDGSDYLNHPVKESRCCCDSALGIPNRFCPIHGQTKEARLYRGEKEEQG